MSGKHYYTDEKNAIDCDCVTEVGWGEYISTAETRTENMV